MNKKYLLFAICYLLFTPAAYANWQNATEYGDDGTRFIVSVHGGGAYGRASISNSLGGFYEIFENEFGDAFEVNVGNFPTTKDFSGTSFAGGASIGVTIPNKPQWRLEVGLEHMSKLDYNVFPLLSDTLTLGDFMYQLDVGDIRSTVATDILGVMAYYDFFDGLQKPIGEFIPYIGFGAGYASSATTLNMEGYALTSLGYEFGAVDDAGYFVSYPSEYNSANIAGILALGGSYGLTRNTFLDVGARLTYIPEVKWALSNEDGTKYRDIFSADGMLYISVVMGLRFEF